MNEERQQKGSSTDLCSGTPRRNTEITINTPQLTPGRQTARKYRIFWQRPNSPSLIKMSSKFMVPSGNRGHPPKLDQNGGKRLAVLHNLIVQGCLLMISNGLFDKNVYLEIFGLSRLSTLPWSGQGAANARRDKLIYRNKSPAVPSYLM